MRIGFTGTQSGMDHRQWQAVKAWLELAASVATHELHHGCCIGADDEVAEIATCDSLKEHFRTHAHPSNLENKTSEIALMFADVKHPVKPPLARNIDIVAACEILLAAPKEMEEERRSGTWMTIRAAKKAGKMVVIFWPDGTKEEIQARPFQLG